MINVKGLIAYTVVHNLITFSVTFIKYTDRHNLQSDIVVVFNLFTANEIKSYSCYII